ncbi:tRNA (guanine37-N1)-methyltransferase [Friedmanniella endophytica]|uniref:tRNA (guanine-N(1)-)-methyltransferase n=1 Tax=Microlunatus kandeliicorticis TaxID=1759536 RepID=A0A7W3IUX0_9ACTN|nr:tRNA (guanosine(37)-N1)-methyltransferase TrmD [Microlunatus kandeliicorticis]MBA8795707.1 tRNA (guanine37-N1)-methyltransferase [Microlunatus kandeliicorticis]
MRIDVLTLFPDYLSPLRLSLVGRAIETGLVELGVHDLRTWTHDRHRTVDDTPYGGGAGMVLRPEPWGEALDELLGPDTAPDADGPRLILLTPSGRPFDQALAAELADERRLLFGCGRYEGFDARIAEHARTRVRTDEVSVGDYVLNGGEVAALAVIEAVVRLVPGVIGNPESLTEESHAPGHDRLLEYPVYTKPPSWRGLDVPAELFRGHHARIAAWRQEQARARTRERRPDLLPPAEQPVVVAEAGPGDAGELFTLQRAAYLAEGRLQGWTIPPLVEELAEVAAELPHQLVLTARQAGRLIGSVRGRADGDTWRVGRLMVVPDRQGEGLGSRLLAAIEARAVGCTRVELVTGAASTHNLAFYARHGYTELRREVDPASGVAVVVLGKPLG